MSFDLIRISLLCVIGALLLWHIVRQFRTGHSNYIASRSAGNKRLSEDIRTIGLFTRALYSFIAINLFIAGAADNSPGFIIAAFLAASAGSDTACLRELFAVQHSTIDKLQSLLMNKSYSANESHPDSE